MGAASISPMPTGQIADSCVLWTGFDISIVARNYAQLAGVLAGFAFVVINLVLDRSYRRRGDGKSRAAHEVEHETLTGVALMNAFLGLFLSAIQYSLLAGENGCSLTGGRAASAELLGGISFVAFVYMLLYAVGPSFLVPGAVMTGRRRSFFEKWAPAHNLPWKRPSRSSRKKRESAALETRRRLPICWVISCPLRRSG